MKNITGYLELTDFDEILRKLVLGTECIFHEWNKSMCCYYVLFITFSSNTIQGIIKAIRGTYDAIRNTAVNDFYSYF